MKIDDWKEEEYNSRQASENAKEERMKGKVYIIIESSIDDVDVIHGVFNTEEKAKGFLKNVTTHYMKTTFSIDVFRLNPKTEAEGKEIITQRRQGRKG